MRVENAAWNVDNRSRISAWRWKRASYSWCTRLQNTTTGKSLLTDILEKQNSNTERLSPLPTRPVSPVDMTDMRSAWSALSDNSLHLRTTAKLQYLQCPVTVHSGRRRHYDRAHSFHSFIQKLGHRQTFATGRLLTVVDVPCRLSVFGHFADKAAAIGRQRICSTSFTRLLDPVSSARRQGWGQCVRHLQLGL